MKKVSEPRFLDLKNVKLYTNKRNGQMTITLPKKKLNLQKGEVPPAKLNLKLLWPHKKN